MALETKNSPTIGGLPLPGNSTLTSSNNPFRDYARAVAKRGWPIFPLVSLGKTPLTSNGFKAATTDAQIIDAWISRWPNANIGIDCGSAGLTVIDLDSSKGASPLHPWNSAGVSSGSDVLALIAERSGATFPTNTLTVQTPNDGWHIYFVNESAPIKSSSGTLGWKIDVRSAGGYVVAAGSRLANGEYRAGIISEVEPLPNWIREAITESLKPRTIGTPTPSRSTPTVAHHSSRYVEVGIRNEIEILKGAQPGTRNNTLNKVAFNIGRLVARDPSLNNFGLNALKITSLAIGLTESEAAQTIASGYRNGRNAVALV